MKKTELKIKIDYVQDGKKKLDKNIKRQRSGDSTRK